jgi:hypothetical protein
MQYEKRLHLRMKRNMDMTIEKIKFLRIKMDYSIYLAKAIFCFFSEQIINWRDHLLLLPSESELSF